MMTIWLLTTEYNDYDQHGEYFVSAWGHRPTFVELGVAGVDGANIRHVQAGGGRKDDEFQWWYLKEMAV